MAVFNTNTAVYPSEISCDGKTTLTVSFESIAKLAIDPAEIVLILDRSSSMAPPKIDDAKLAAKELVDMIATASGGTNIGSGSKMGLISFSSTAKEDMQLTEDATALKDSIDAIQFGGSTNHRAAFEAAENILPPKTDKRQIVIMFTDGVTTTGGDATAVTDRMKAAGVEIYCIGLLADPAQLNLWATNPIDEHVVFNTDPKQLEKLFREVATEVILAGAKDVVIQGNLTGDFEILSVKTPTAGTVQVDNPQQLTWSIDAVGLEKSATREFLTIEMMHVGTDGGTKDLTQSILYQDKAGNTLDFPTAQVNVICKSGGVYVESCPKGVDILADGCADSVIAEVPNVTLQSLGRIIEVNATIQNVCPGKRVAAAILLTELDASGIAHNRGLKTVMIPAHAESQCKDVTLHCVKFVVPEALDVTGSSDSLCNARNFKAQVFANYVDTDYICCASASTIV